MDLEFWSVPRMWEGQTVVCMATGESMTFEVAESVRGRVPVIAINDAIYQAPWADIHFTADLRWWEWVDAGTLPAQQIVGMEEARRIIAEFSGHRVIMQNHAKRREADPTIKVLRNDTSWDENGNVRESHLAVTKYTGGLCLRPDGVRTGRNSGHMALNVAVHTGAKRILLLGYDMRGDHWFGVHPINAGRPFEEWKRHFATLPPILAELGVEVINVTPGSALTCFPRGVLEDCL